MSQQGPILVVSTAERPSFASVLDEAKLFPLIETEWADAAHAVERLQPAAVIAAAAKIDEAGLAALAEPIALRQPYLPLIAVDPHARLPENAIPFFQTQDTPARLVTRLRAALRIRSLHATVMRRLAPPAPITLRDIDTSRDATVLWCTCSSSAVRRSDPNTKNASTVLTSSAPAGVAASSSTRRTSGLRCTRSRGRSASNSSTLRRS